MLHLCHDGTSTKNNAFCKEVVGKEKRREKKKKKEKKKGEEEEKEKKGDKENLCAHTSYDGKSILQPIQNLS